MLNTLNFNFPPQKILHRDEQIRSINEVFGNFKKFGVGANKILLGVTGSGKTTVVKYVISSQDPQSYIYSSVSEDKTSFKVLKKISNIKSHDFSKLIGGVIDSLKQNPRVLIIDELNKIDNPRVLFDDLNTIFRETGVPIILITNNRKILSEMAEDARLTLFFERVEFPSYNSSQLYDILVNRLISVNNEILPLFSEEVLRYITAVSTKDGGSARTALELVQKCIMRNTFTIEGIDKLIIEKKRDELEEYYLGMPPLEKEFLKTLIELYFSEDDIEITPSLLRTKMPKLLPQRISLLITTFEKEYGLITTKEFNMGNKGGRYRIIMPDHDLFLLLDGVID